MNLIKTMFTTTFFMFGNFIAGVVKQARKVRWPGRDDLLKATILVIAVTIFFGVFLASTDYLLVRMFQNLGI